MNDVPVDLLIFKVNQLGDNVVFLPIVQEIRRRFPAWNLKVWTSPVAAPLYQGCLRPEELRLIPTAEFNGSWRRPWKLAGYLREIICSKIDASLLGDDQANVAHLLARVAGGKIRVGAQRHFVKIPHSLTNALPIPQDQSVVTWNWAIASCLVRELTGSGLPERPPVPDVSHLAGGLAPISDRVVIHAGASRDYKKWFLDHYIELANRLSKHAEVVWINQTEPLPAPLLPQIIQVETRTLPELVRILSSAHIFVGNNSGPMNIAAALGRPMVILSGPSLRSWDPYWNWDRCLILRDESLSCLPCDTAEGPRNRCTNERNPMACMKYWSVDKVKKITLEWMDQWKQTTSSIP